MQYIKGLKFEEEPNYEYLHGLFKEQLAKEEVESKILMDWAIKVVIFNIKIRTIKITSMEMKGKRTKYQTN